MTDTATPAETDWAALLGAATTEDKALTAKRTTVPVPPAVLAFVTNLRDKAERAYLPYDAAKYGEMCDLFYSAADLLTPKASAIIVRTDGNTKAAKVYKAGDPDVGVTHVRITIAERRGIKDKPADKPADTPADKTDG